MILVAKHHFVIYPFFVRYSIRQTARKFGEVRISGEFDDRGLPVLLVSNHISWWDGFWAVVLNEKIIRRKFHFMMLEDQLRKHWYFRHCGGFSVRRNSRGLLESLEYASSLLQNPQNLVLLFPQGEIQSMHTHEFRFEKGIERILEGKEGEVHLLFSVNMLDYLSQSLPGLFIYFREECSVPFTRDKIQESYNAFYRQCLEKQRLLTS